MGDHVIAHFCLRREILQAHKIKQCAPKSKNSRKGAKVRKEKLCGLYASSRLCVKFFFLVPVYPNLGCEVFGMPLASDSGLLARHALAGSISTLIFAHLPC